MQVVTTNPGLKILITRLSHIGDCVLTLPVACALRDALPGAQIVWVVEKPSDQMIQGHDAIDDLIAVPRGFLKQPRTVFALRKQLRDIGCDVAFDPQSLTKSSLIGWLAGVPRRIGLDRPWARELAPLLNTELLIPEKPHVVDRSLDLLRALGIEQPSVRFSLPDSQIAVETVGQFLRTAHLGCDFAVINAGAGWESRRWMPRRFGSVARHLGQSYQVPSVVAWAGADELQLAEAIVAQSGGHALLAPRTSICELTSLLRSAKFYVGSDTGPMHLAAAVDTPCVALFGPTLPENSGPYGNGHITVQAFYQEFDRRRCDAAMRAIEVPQVVQACDEMMARLSIQPVRSATDTQAA